MELIAKLLNPEAMIFVEAVGELLGAAARVQAIQFLLIFYVAWKIVKRDAQKQIADIADKMRVSLGEVVRSHLGSIESSLKNLVCEVSGLKEELSKVEHGHANRLTAVEMLVQEIRAHIGLEKPTEGGKNG